MKIRTIGLLAMLVIGILISTTAVSAYRGDPNTQGPNFDEERHEAMQVAFADVDYDEWYKLMSEDGRMTRVMEVVNEENFATFVESHNAALAGDFETADALRAELGLNNGQGPRDGTGFHRGEGRRMQNQRMENFIDADGNGECDNLGLGSQGRMNGGKGRFHAE